MCAAANASALAIGRLVPKRRSCSIRSWGQFNGFARQPAFKGQVGRVALPCAFPCETTRTSDAARPLPSHPLAPHVHFDGWQSSHVRWLQQEGAHTHPHAHAHARTCTQSRTHAHLEYPSTFQVTPVETWHQGTHCFDARASNLTWPPGCGCLECVAGQRVAGSPLVGCAGSAPSPHLMRRGPTEHRPTADVLRGLAAPAAIQPSAPYLPYKL